MAEQGTVNPWVVGSSPTSPAMKIYEISSFEDIDIEDCLNEFKTSGLFLFRGYDMSHEEQIKIMQAIADRFDWTPGKEKKVFSRYTENHNTNMSNLDRKKMKYEILISWHMEHIGLKNPAIGASWNMRKFNCSPEAGKTLFCDGVELCAALDKETLDFLEKCEFIWRPPNATHLEHIQLEPIRKHEITGLPMVYLPAMKINGFGEYLHTYDGEEPSTEQKATFESINDAIWTDMYSNSSIHITQKWAQYDVIFVDLTRMYHAVTGGFSEDEREFSGVWAFDDFSSALDNIG